MDFLSRIAFLPKFRIIVLTIFFLLIALIIYLNTLSSAVLSIDDYLSESKIIILGTFALLLPTTAILLFVILYYRRQITRTDFDKKPNDEQRLLSVKRKYLDSILEQLKLEVDKDLKKCLEESDIDGANDLIKEKIDALNSLVETVKGDDSKVLRGTDISTIANFYDSTNDRIQGEILRIKIGRASCRERV